MLKPADSAAAHRTAHRSCTSQHRRKLHSKCICSKHLPPQQQRQKCSHELQHKSQGFTIYSKEAVKHLGAMHCVSCRLPTRPIDPSPILRLICSWSYSMTGQLIPSSSSKLLVRDLFCWYASRDCLLGPFAGLPCP